MKGTEAGEVFARFSQRYGFRNDINYIKLSFDFVDFIHAVVYTLPDGVSTKRLYDTTENYTQDSSVCQTYIEGRNLAYSKAA